MQLISEREIGLLEKGISLKEAIAMKYSTNEQVRVIMERGELLRKRKERRITGALGSAASVLAVMLVLSIGKFAGTGSMKGSYNYGSFLLAEETGGYVLVGLIAFLLGVVLTAIIYRRRCERQ